MLIEYADINERRRELARLIDVEDRMFVEVEGQPRVYAIADEDLDRETDEKTQRCTSCALNSLHRCVPRCWRARASNSVAITPTIRTHRDRAGATGVPEEGHPRVARRQCR